MTTAPRSAAYCIVCDRIVELAEEGTCPALHPAAAIVGVIALEDGEPVPALPHFNWAAFALPPVWGPAHGQWVGLLFVPIWLFADSSVEAASVSPLARAAAVAVVSATLAFQVFFAKRANGLAWRRVWQTTSVAEFRRRQRAWALACVPIGGAVMAAAVWYRFFA